LKAPGFNPSGTYEVLKSRFQAFAFKWVNLYRYNEQRKSIVALDEVGLCTLNSFDP
jgi:hypothetical protein